MLEVSVIVPVYKVEKYLDRCVASILSQTFPHFELILVDDGSPDQCGKICERWAKKDARVVVVHKENGGLSSARNAGLDICRGKWICFVDSDDWIPKDSLQYLYDLRKKYEADFSMAANIRVHQRQKQEQDGYLERELTQREFLTKLFKIGTQENVQYAWAKLYKKELFDSVRFPEGLIDEDVPTTFRVALKSAKIAYSTKIAYFYFCNPGSITDEGFNDRKFDLLTVWDIVCEEAKKQGDPWVADGALMNRKRADFGILMDLAISGIPLRSKREYLKKAKGSISALRKNAHELYKADIPLSRKFFIFCFSKSYHLSFLLLHCVSKAVKGIGKKGGSKSA